MAAYYQQSQLATPHRAYLPTSAGAIPYNPAAVNSGAMMGSSTGSTMYGTGMTTGMAGTNPAIAQQQMGQYYAPGMSYPQASMGAYPQQSQAIAPQAVTTTQPSAFAPMASTASTTTAGAGAGINPAASLGAANPAAANTVAEGEAEAETETAEAAGGVGTCWGCCGPAGAPGGAAEVAAGGPVGASASAAPGPTGPAGPAGERVVEYFKSGYNSAAAGANTGAGLPANIFPAPAARGGAQAL